jgi:hypothetical protein
VLFPVSRVRRFKAKKKRKEGCFAGRMESFDSEEFGLSSLNNSRTMLWFFGFFCLLIGFLPFLQLQLVPTRVAAFLWTRVTDRRRFFCCCSYSYRC